MSSSLTHPTVDPTPSSRRPSVSRLSSSVRTSSNVTPWRSPGLYRLGARSGARPAAPAAARRAARRSSTTAYRFLSAAVTKDAPAVGSEDWLRDNHHVVQDQVREIRQDLPRKYYLELPKLADGPLAGYPRVYAFARELIAHTAGRLDLQTLVDFAAAYQRVAPLTIGEIWAIPIMLRLALVEELRRLADDVVAARRSRDRARALGRAAEHRRAASPNAIIDEMLRDEAAASGRLSAAFVVELLQWLRDQPSSAAPAWHALQRALEAQDDSPEEMLRVEHQREAAEPARHRQHHHEHAAAVVDRLAALLRARQPGRADPARRSGRRLRADGLSDARPLPPLGRAAGARGARRRSRTSPARAVALARGGAADALRSTIAAITSATT